jgi:hypothetical protein
VLSVAEQADAARANHWTLLPIQRPPFPQVNNAAWIRRPLDTYVLAGLDGAGITPSPQAGRHTLIRRATFDLWGLPPTAEQVETFLNDSAPDAYERMVERLLASPRYGERWGRHWLDVARYADTRGYAFNRERRYPYAYTYRDYVIDAMNQDKTFDLFVLEQLAADQLATDDSSLAALGFLTVGRRFNNRHDDIDDQIDVVTRGLLGLTVACARCHHHKYDAIPMEDYYALYGIFASCHEPDELPLIGDPQDVPGYDTFKQQLDSLTADRDRYEDKKHVELREHAREKVAEYLVRAICKDNDKLLEKLPFVSLGKDDLKPKLVARWRTYLVQHANSEDPVWGPLFAMATIADDEFTEKVIPILDRLRDTPEGTEVGQVNERVKHTLLDPPLTTRHEAAYRYGVLLTDAYQQWSEAGGNEDAKKKLSPADSQLAAILIDADSPVDVPRNEITGYFNRADRNKHTELQKKIDAHQVNSAGAPPRAMVVRDNEQPHEPRIFLRGNHARLGAQVPRQFLLLLAGSDREPYRDGSGRLQLAEAIIAPENPLTARVLANRLWMHHFGEPLVDTPSDFGIRCEPPPQEDLLNYLAWKLHDQDWSLKSLHREILYSNTYRQASNFRSHCATVDPENRLLWRMNRRRLEFEPLRDAALFVSGRLDLTAGGRPEEITKAPFSRRRSVYGFIDRQDLPNLFRVFDFASPDQTQSKRPRTTVPQQALFMMNSPFIIEQSQALANMVQNKTEKTDERIQLLYQSVFARPADTQEVAWGEELLNSLDAAAKEGAPWPQYAQLLLMTNEFVFVD